MNSKRCISPVISISLLLIVSIVAVATFSNWFDTYRSDMTSNLEMQSNDKMAKDMDVYFDSNVLYIKNKADITLNLNMMKFDDDDCFLNATIKPGMNEVKVGACVRNIGEIFDLVMYFDNQVVEKRIFASNVNYLDCPNLYAGNWSLVPGDESLGIKDFCVMTYEAKWDGRGTINNTDKAYCGNSNDYNESIGGCPIDGSIGIVSKAEDPPLVQVNLFEARALCRNIGEGYHLITNAEWITMARDLELVPFNWVDGVVGSLVADGGGFKAGNVGFENSVSYDGDFNEGGYGRNTKSLFKLSTGDVLWDICGNVWEWVNDTIDCSSVGYPCTGIMPYDSTPDTEWIVYDDLVDYGVLGVEGISPLDITMSFPYGGFGLINTRVDPSFPSDSAWNLTHGIIRSGNTVSLNYGGLYSINVYSGPSMESNGVGIRCVYTARDDTY